MGFWGAGPFDNDFAGDIVASMMKPCRAIIAANADGELARTYYAAARVGIQMRLLAHGTDILGGPPLAIALDALKHIRADRAWIGNWKSPAKLRSALDAEIRAVRKAMKATAQGKKKRSRK